MGDAFNRLTILMGDTLQILDYMKVDSSQDELLQQIISGLRDLKSNAEELSYQNGEEASLSAITMSQRLSELSNVVRELEQQLLDDYRVSTDYKIEQYEQMAIEEQMEQKENYHNKIDYLSTVKIRENINRMNEVLLQIIS